MNINLHNLQYFCSRYFYRRQRERRREREFLYIVNGFNDQRLPLNGLGSGGSGGGDTKRDFRPTIKNTQANKMRRLLPSEMWLQQCCQETFVCKRKYSISFVWSKLRQSETTYSISKHACVCSCVETFIYRKHFS